MPPPKESILDRVGSVHRVAMAYVPSRVQWRMAADGGREQQISHIDATSPVSHALMSHVKSDITFVQSAIDARTGACGMVSVHRELERMTRSVDSHELPSVTTSLLIMLAAKLDEYAQGLLAVAPGDPARPPPPVPRRSLVKSVVHLMHNIAAGKPSGEVGEEVCWGPTRPSSTALPPATRAPTPGGDAARGRPPSRTSLSQWKRRAAGEGPPSEASVAASPVLALPAAERHAPSTVSGSPVAQSPKGSEHDVAAQLKRELHIRTQLEARLGAAQVQLVEKQRQLDFFRYLHAHVHRAEPHAALSQMLMGSEALKKRGIDVPSIMSEAVVVTPPEREVDVPPIPIAGGGVPKTERGKGKRESNVRNACDDSEGPTAVIRMQNAIIDMLLQQLQQAEDSAAEVQNKAKIQVDTASRIAESRVDALVEENRLLRAAREMQLSAAASIADATAATLVDESAWSRPASAMHGTANDEVVLGLPRPLSRSARSHGTPQTSSTALVPTRLEELDPAMQQEQFRRMLRDQSALLASIIQDTNRKMMPTSQPHELAAAMSTK